MINVSAVLVHVIHLSHVAYLFHLAVVLLNVLGFYGPIREMVRNGVRAGFIPPSNEGLIRFVDGPEDMSAHEEFDWGTGQKSIFKLCHRITHLAHLAALEALESWSSNIKTVYSYDWTKVRNGASQSTTDSLQYT